MSTAELVAEPAAPSAITQVLQRPGTPLDAAARAFMEPRFGRDLAGVRMHTDAVAARSASAVSALAYACGEHIVFGAGHYRPDTAGGRRLLAHELAHVLQQAPLRDPAQPLHVGATHGATERQADRMAGAALAGATTTEAPTAAPTQIARQTVDVDLEVPAPAELEALRARGVELPSVSATAADPRQHSDYIDGRVSGVGFGLYLGGFMAYCDGLPVPIFVPDALIDLEARTVATPDPAIHPDYARAQATLPYGPLAPGVPAPVAFYRGAGGAVIAPTTFSPATTPRFVATALAARRAWAADAQAAMEVLAVSLLGGMALRALVQRIMRIGTGPVRTVVPPVSGATVGREIAAEMRTGGFRGNPFREIMRRLNARPQRLPPAEAADAIEVAAREFTAATMGTMPPVQQGQVLVVPSRVPLPNAPVLGVRADGTVVMGRAPRLVIVRDPAGVPVHPPRVELDGAVVWDP